jgi:hypothetical protein
MALLALIGVVWLVVQPTAQSVRYPAGAGTAQLSVESREAGLASRDIDRERLERKALLDDIGRPRRIGEIDAVSTEARRDPTIVVAQTHEPQALKPPLSQLGDLRPAVAIVETVRESVALVSPEPARAVSSEAMTAAEAGRRDSASDTATVEDSPSLATLGPRRAEEVGLPVAVLSAQPPAAGPQDAAPPLPGALAPGSGDRRGSAASVAAASAKPSAEAAEPDARSQRKARARAKARSRAEARAARLKLKSRNATRYSRRNRRAAEVAPQQQSASPPPPGPQVVEPGLLPAARLLQGWNREWRTGLAPRIRQPALQ